MNRLTVSIRGPHGRVRQVLVELADGAVVGDDDASLASFPGARLVVRRSAAGWSLDGHLLHTGRALTFRFGEVEVTVEPEVDDRPVRAGLDPTLVVAFFALLLLVSALGVGQRLWATRSDHAPSAVVPR